MYNRQCFPYIKADFSCAFRLKNSHHSQDTELDEQINGFFQPTYDVSTSSALTSPVDALPQCSVEYKGHPLGGVVIGTIESDVIDLYDL